MSFTQPCFIRKNTPELRKKLEDLGYNKSKFGNTLNNSIATTVSNDKSSYTCIKDQSFDDTNPHTTWGLKFRIDCGDNELLFLALAALRNDTDKNQYCIDSEGNWFLYNGTFVGLLSKTNVTWHKATVEELIEHFKTE